MKSLSAAAFAVAIVLVSCQKDVHTVTGSTTSSPQFSNATAESPLKGKWKQFAPVLRTKNATIRKTDEYYKQYLSNTRKAVMPSECAAGKLDKIVESYFAQFEFWDYVLFGDYASISQLAAVIDQSKQYFGEKGEYTHLVSKHQRKLETFWNIPGPIRVNGQHSATLNSRDKIAEVFIRFSGASQEDGYYIADQVIAMGKDSRVLPETPLLAFDGFSTTSKLIVIGDGLIKAVTETGVVDDVVVAGILSHEWGHQVQFAYSKTWYGYAADQLPFTPELTRQLELEADFFSSYFLTHKRGATYNWKKVAEFNELFFNMGDCAFESSGHHGTPRQRLNASMLGYKIANETKPQGHILSADQLHKIFVQNFKSLL